MGSISKWIPGFYEQVSTLLLSPQNSQNGGFLPFTMRGVMMSARNSLCSRELFFMLTSYGCYSGLSLSALSSLTANEIKINGYHSYYSLIIIPMMPHPYYNTKYNNTNE